MRKKWYPALIETCFYSFKVLGVLWCLQFMYSVNLSVNHFNLCHTNVCPLFFSLPGCCSVTPGTGCAFIAMNMLAVERKQQKSGCFCTQLLKECAMGKYLLLGWGLLRTRPCCVTNEACVRNIKNGFRENPSCLWNVLNREEYLHKNKWETDAWIWSGRVNPERRETWVECLHVLAGQDNSRDETLFRLDLHHLC